MSTLGQLATALVERVMLRPQPKEWSAMPEKSEQPEGPSSEYEPPKVEEVSTEAGPAITAAGTSVTDTE